MPNAAFFKIRPKNPVRQLKETAQGIIIWYEYAERYGVFANFGGFASAPHPTRKEKTEMRRSMLFLPGNTPNMIINGDALGADSIILDLEDAVSPDERIPQGCSFAAQ